MKAYYVEVRKEELIKSLKAESSKLNLASTDVPVIARHKQQQTRPGIRRIYDVPVSVRSAGSLCKLWVFSLQSCKGGPACFPPGLRILPASHLITS